eukprot:m.476909 g.476909  ORF g.476909 m.476909 type:complete len:395 (+) comp20694_c0_seq1:65-1249(+)
MAGALNPAITAEFVNLDQGGRVLAEYVWIDGTGITLRSKTKVLNSAPKSVDDLPIWNYDGSSTGQAPGEDSEVLLKPVRIFRDPFRADPNILVLCETYRPLGGGDMEPLKLAEQDLIEQWGITGNNTRADALKIFQTKEVAEQKCWYGLEQEYTLFHEDKVTPLGWPKSGFPGPQGPYYCSAGVGNAFGRDVADAHMKACLYAGITISGLNGEVMPGQWEYQVGPCEGIESGDHAAMARYIMFRVSERFNVHVSFDAKPILGDWNGAGCHTNFSTADMRNPKMKYEYTPESGPYAGKKLTGGFAKIVEGCDKIGAKAAELLHVYGSGNEQRLTGKHETADMSTFNYGVANRGASIRIPRETEGKGYGYLEDRRPSANMDAYVVTSKIAEAVLLA